MSDRISVLLKFEELVNYMLSTRPLQGMTMEVIKTHIAKIKSDLDAGVIDETMLDELVKREKLIAVVVSNRSRMGYPQNEIATKVAQTLKDIGGVKNGKH